MEGFFICRAIFKSHVKPPLKVRAFIQPREHMKIKTDQSLNACPATYVGVALRNRKLSLSPLPPPPSSHIHILQLNAGAINYFFFVTWTLSELFRFFQQRFALNAGKKHAQLMKSKATVGITSEESGKKTIFKVYVITLKARVNMTSEPHGCFGWFPFIGGIKKDECESVDC